MIQKNKNKGLESYYGQKEKSRDFIAFKPTLTLHEAFHAIRSIFSFLKFNQVIKHVNAL